MKCSSVSVIGRPSSGKSTLINTICEAKVSITARTPQTTRNTIKGIYTDQRGQLIFVDTPGYHHSEQSFNKRLQDLAINALNDNDIILYIVDTKREIGKEEEEIANLVNKRNKATICALNKSDISSKEEIENSKNNLSSLLPSNTVFVEISGLEDNGVDQLLIELFKMSKEGPLLYDENTRTDQDLEFRITEIIREKAIKLVSKEIPHAIFVEVSDLEYNEKENTIWLRAFINVERESQKGIVVGKGGKNIKTIRVESMKEIKKIFPGSKLTVDLRVKVKNKWKTNLYILNKTVF